MNIMKKTGLLLLVVVMIIFGLTGCESNTVQKYIISTEKYANKADLDEAAQPDTIAAGQNIYASVYFIESPLGMEYTAKWYLNGAEIKSDKQKMPTDKHGIIVFTLGADQVTKGTLKLEIKYGEDILCSKEIVVQ